eukprot:4798028-Lingulodinium_polyedra.AAC.1
MSTECSLGDQNVAHTAQKCVDNCNVDHAKFGATQTPPLVKTYAESPKAKKGALWGTPPQAPEQCWLGKAHQYIVSSGANDEEAVNEI